MARYSATHKSITPTATADTTNLVDSTYPLAIVGGSTTQVIKIHEVLLTGQAASSSPTFMVLARDSTLGATLTSDTNLTTAPLHPDSTALASLATAPVVFNKATTKPQRAATLTLLNLSFNAYGGSVKWVPNSEGGEVFQVGNAVNRGETSLSAFTGGTPGLLGAQVILEPM